jgi:hypothetical protein
LPNGTICPMSSRRPESAAVMFPLNVSSI